MRRAFGLSRALVRALRGTASERPLSLALQGGGSFGAFTWGVLDRLLEERDIRFDAISGASAGAVNAVLVASGMIENRAEAKAKLARFWKRMSHSASYLPITALASATMGASLSHFARTLSPYQSNPFDLNPLRQALAAEIDFERLRAQSPVKLLIAATRVRNGQLRIFRESELSVETVLASACLPLIHHAIEIDGESYWDGGYVANPPLIPLVQASDAANILVVQVTPAKSDRLPKTSREILKRIDQINFNSTLNAEIEAVKIGISVGATPKLRRLRIDRISAQDEFEGLADQNAANLGWGFLKRLRESGRNAAETWIARPTA
ncbi:MAG TPA: patatin-like phospholipase family protein [Stellaceae bacterium]|nr:patatin-like phospholipase family protein [Stellaceae bacterium]